MRRVLVTSFVACARWPVFGMSSPFSAEWFLTKSGVSPWAICHTISPWLRSIAVILPHGGFMSGSPRTVSRRPISGPGLFLKPIRLVSLITLVLLETRFIRTALIAIFTLVALAACEGAARHMPS